MPSAIVHDFVMVNVMMSALGSGRGHHSHHQVRLGRIWVRLPGPFQPGLPGPLQPGPEDFLLGIVAESPNWES